MTAAFSQRWCRESKSIALATNNVICLSIPVELEILPDPRALQVVNVFESVQIKDHCRCAVIPPVCSLAAVKTIQ